MRNLFIAVLLVMLTLSTVSAQIWSRDQVRTIEHWIEADAPDDSGTYDEEASGNSMDCLIWNIGDVPVNSYILAIDLHVTDEFKGGAAGTDSLSIGTPTDNDYFAGDTKATAGVKSITPDATGRKYMIVNAKGRRVVAYSHSGSDHQATTGTAWVCIRYVKAKGSKP